MKKTFETLAEVSAHVGQEVAVSDWLTITQDQINQFASATLDHQWIHTIAHGFLTLSLLPAMFASAFEIKQTRMGINYGLNKVRFTAPVPVGGRLRGHMHLLACEAIEPQGVQMTWRVTVELEGADKPVCIAESLVRQYA
jgi:acyl dehydratase